MSAPGRPQVLYLTTFDQLAGAAGLSRETRIVVGVLARDFDLSLAIAGPIDHQELQELRDHFASVRAAGGLLEGGWGGLLFSDTATTEIYTLILHDALQISTCFSTLSAEERIILPWVCRQIIKDLFFVFSRCRRSCMSTRFSRVCAQGEGC